MYINILKINCVCSCALKGSGFFAVFEVFIYAFICGLLTNNVQINWPEI